MVTKEYSLENHTVQVCDLSTDEIAKSNNWIGSNQVGIINFNLNDRKLYEYQISF